MSENELRVFTKKDLDQFIREHRHDAWCEGRDAVAVLADEHVQAAVYSYSATRAIETVAREIRALKSPYEVKK